MFNKHGNKSILKYRREFTSNIKFQADRRFVRNDLSEQVIKSCKATSTEFLIFKEKPGICLYEEIYYEVENIQIQDHIKEADKEPIKVIDKVSNVKSTEELIEESDKKLNEESIKKSNKELDKKMSEVLNKYSDDMEKIDEMFKESNKKSSKELNKVSNKELNKESKKELNKKSDKKLNKEANKESNKELIKTISPKNDENTTNWYDKNKFNEILVTVTTLIIKIL